MSNKRKIITPEELKAKREQQLAKQEKSFEKGDCKYDVVAEMFLAQCAKDSLSTDGGTSDDGYAHVERLFATAHKFSGMRDGEFEDFILTCLRHYKERM